MAMVAAIAVRLSDAIAMTTDNWTPSSRTTFQPRRKKMPDAIKAAQLSALSTKVSQLLQGENLHDVASVLSVLAAWSIAMAPIELETRKRNLDEIIESMRKTFDVASRKKPRRAEVKITSVKPAAHWHHRQAAAPDRVLQAELEVCKRIITLPTCGPRSSS